MFKVRKIFILFVAIFCAENLFAEYAGNLQIRAGVSLEKMQRQNLKLNSQISGSDWIKEKSGSTNFYLALTSYNIWYLHDGNFGIGFVADIEDLLSYLFLLINREASTWDMMLGPAFGFRINNVMKIQTGIGVNVGFFIARYYGSYSYGPYSYHDYSVDDGNGFGLGVAFDFNLEFLPNAAFSPVIGFRFGSIFPTNGGHVHYESYEKLPVENSQNNGQNNYDADYKIRNYSFRFYVGGAFNFGR